MISMLKQIFLMFPLLILSFSIILNLFIIICKRDFFLSFLVTFSGLFGAFFSYVLFTKSVNTHLKCFLFSKSFSVFYIFLFFLGSISTCVISYIWLRSKSFNKEEFYLLLLISNIGSYLLFLSNNIFSFFIGIELLSFPLFGMMSYNSSKNFKNLESAFKYFILSSISSIFLLLGIALIYLSSGILDFFLLKSFSFSLSKSLNLLFLFGLIFSCISLFIKIVVFPFYLWIPDIYEGNSLPVLIYLSNSIKTVLFIILLKLFFLFSNKNFIFFTSTLKIISIFSVFLGSILALFQKNFKRLIGYTTLINSGYLIIIAMFLCKNNSYQDVSKIYFFGYFLNSLVLFSSMHLLSILFVDKNSHSFESYKGCFWKSKILSISIIISLLSMIGFPLTIGFFGKFYLLKLIIEKFNILFGLSVIFESVIGIFYYLNFIKLFFYRPKKESFQIFLKETILYKFLKIIIFLCSLLIVFIGIFPNFFLSI
ncbi:MAG: NADH-quinone oxidoreductase subunit N [Buchnera aphidicola (Periphyllus acericola)]|nr:NADH-quinone oxidoreductase subunit N [Buchnera aphidicola (Periphyllus acericola)]